MTKDNHDFDPARFDKDRASGYAERVRRVIPGYDALHDLLRLMIDENTPSDGHILVAGCGTGEEIIRLGMHGPRLRFMGVDPSGDMLSIARERIDRTDIKDRTTLVEGRVRDLDEDLRFDAATLMLVLHFIPCGPGPDGKVAFLTEIAKRLKSGAPLFIADGLSEPGDPSFEATMAIWRKWRKLRGISEEAETGNTEKALKNIPFATPGDERAILMKAGFRTIQPIYRALHVHGLLAFKG